MFSNLDDTTHQFANFCLAAYKTDPKYCTFAGPSINSQDPVTDMVNRINGVNDYLSKNPYGLPLLNKNETWTFLDTAGLLTDLGNPFEVWYWAQIYHNLEMSLQNVSTGRIKRQVSSNWNLSFASLDATEFNPVSDGVYTNTIIECAESSSIGINDIDSFSEYVKQTEDNPLIAYQSLWWNWKHIPCPNLTLYNPERLPTQFSSSVRNRTIVAAQTHTFGYPMTAAMNTYDLPNLQWIGETQIDAKSEM